MPEIQYASIDRWPGKLRDNRIPAPFKRSTFGDTLRLLERELRMISAEGILCRLAISMKDMNRDGSLSASARPSHPGVILSLKKSIQRPTGERIKLPLNFPCDRFTHWQDNLRAIAIALEDLRRIDRYGVTQNSEQYAGFKALPPVGPSHESIETVEQAAAFLASVSGIAAYAVQNQPDGYRQAYRTVASVAHPDAKGNPEDWARLQAAKTLLDAHHHI